MITARRFMALLTAIVGLAVFTPTTFYEADVTIDQWGYVINHVLRRVYE